jgi:hypothetical protein
MNDPCLHSFVPAGIIYMYFDFKCSRTRSQLVYDSGMRSGESLGSSAGRACLPARRLSSRSVCSFTVPACLPQSPARRNPPPPLPRSLERTLQPPCRIRTPLRPINRIRPGAACSSEVDVSAGAAVSGVSDDAAGSAGFWLPSAVCALQPAANSARTVSRQMTAIKAVLLWKKDWNCFMAGSFLRVFTAAS